ncbi:MULTISPECIES: sensor histidine kinase [Microvirga]|uniref:sensor histidine kinase n=1 Tax=Microvirga TaxID=186650 RepID=UPI001CFFD1AE|nr:sensor histidine kinase [Microvirga lenta]MCB5177618.1 PAS domain-containing protein [Microvirga lenta]
MDLNATESQFAVLAESLPQLVWSARPDGYHDYFNRRWHEFTGLTMEQSFGEGWTGAVHPDDLPTVLDRWHASLEAGQPYEGECRIRRADGHYSWMLSRGIPIQDMSGTIARWFGTCTDIDGQKQAEESLRTLEEQHRLALEAARLGTWRIDLDAGTVSWDEGTCALFNIPPDGLHSMPLEEAMERVHPDDRQAVKEHMAAATAPGSGGRYEAEYRTILSDGSVRWMRSNGSVRFVGSGDRPRAVSLSGIISDITEQKASQEAQQLLTRELTHRVKNLFAIANGMVSMTARTAKDPKEMANALRGRLSALSRAHELVQPVSASGAHGGSEVDLKKLIESVLAPYTQVEGGRIVAEGPEVRVGSNTTTSLALVLHELATNAAKYGCLSNSEGQLAIRWRIDGDDVRIDWTEVGGPPVLGPPSFEGFGSQLAQRSIAGQLGGTLEREWRTEGLCVHMAMPLGRLTA